MKTVYFHGEVCLLTTGSIQKGLKKVKSKDGKFILANSETSGNHHVLVAKDGVDVYEGVDGTLYVHVEESAEVKCVMEERHDTQVLPAGDYIVRRKVEYDHLLNTKKFVAD